MKISNKIIAFTSILCAALAGCQPDAEDCSPGDCRELPSPSDEAETAIPGFSRFTIEIVGEGEVLVNEESCSTSEGICHVDVPPGTVIALDGDFLFTSETGDATDEGQCGRERGCRLLIDGDVRVVAHVDVPGDEPGGRHIERRPFGRLPGQPGMIVDNFHDLSPHSRDTLNQRVVNEN